MALDKSVAATQQLPVFPGDLVTFTITVMNQGNVDAYNVDLADNIPAGLTLIDQDWIDIGGVADLTFPIPGPIVPGASVSVDISFAINDDFMGNTIENSAEITEADNDEDPTNDPPNDIDSDEGNDAVSYTHLTLPTTPYV